MVFATLLILLGKGNTTKYEQKNSNINPNEMYFRDINIITSYSCGPDDTREAIRIIERAIVNADLLVTHRFPIEETEKAFRITAAQIQFTRKWGTGVLDTKHYSIEGLCPSNSLK